MNRYICKGETRRDHNEDNWKRKKKIRREKNIMRREKRK